jgi:hypothetical protein
MFMTRSKFRNGSVLPTVFTLGVALSVLIWFCFTLGNAENGGTEAGRIAAENAVKRAALSCYAVEGAYPPDYKYLEAHYGIKVDSNRYIVHYEIFASNIMPDIAVFALGGDKP